MDELISEFLTETQEGLSKIDNALLELETDPYNHDILSSIFRVLHTIKGTSGFLGLEKLEKTAHAGESLLDRLRSKEIEASEVVISTIFKAVDAIKSIVDSIKSTGEEPASSEYAELVANIHLILEGKTPQVDEQSTQAELQEIPEEVAISTQEEKADVEKTVPAITPPSQVAVTSTEHNKLVKAPATTNESIRVNIDILEQLMQNVSELVLLRNQLLQVLRSNNQAHSLFQSPLQRLSMITSELQANIMKTRMQPISNIWTQYPRLVRDLSKELNKKIRVVMEGEDTELDRHILELIKDPLTHMIRNSCDHGIEVPEARIQSKKNEQGTILLKAYHEGGFVIMEVIDDGKGLDVEKLKAKIIKQGILTENAIIGMSDNQIYQYIFHPGFSTAEKVTSVSGRGVGMDVVKTNIEKIGGSIELESVFGKGMRFIIKIPLTLAIMPVLIVKIGELRFALPQVNVVEIIKVSGENDYSIDIINNSPVMKLRDELIPLLLLAEELQATNIDHQSLKHKNSYVVVTQVGNLTYGIVVDKIYDTEEIVVKPVSNMLKEIKQYAGNTILGDGSIIMVLDPNGLVKNIAQTASQFDKVAAKQIFEEQVSLRVSKLLLVRCHDQVIRAIPLEMVSRLEELDFSNLEYSIEQPIIQYRGSIMRLVAFEDNFAIPNHGIRQVVVFTDGLKTIGLVVEDILDVVAHEFKEIVATAVSPKVMGTSIVGGKNRDIIDIGYFFQKIYGIEEKKPAQRENKSHILLVDDSTFFRKFIPPAIESAGYKVTTVENVQKAIDILDAANDFSLIITDLNMPGLSGVDLARHVKNKPETTKIPIVALSSYTSDEFIKNNHDIENFDGFVSKTHHSKLLEKISELVA